MNSKKVNYLALASMLSIGLSTALTASAEDVVVSGGQIGAGGYVSDSNTAGKTGGLTAQVQGYAIGQERNGPFVYSVLGTAQYNAINTNEKVGFSTGLEGRLAGFAGGTLLKGDDDGCDIYAGVGLNFFATGQTLRPGDNNVTVSAGPETGLLCRMSRDFILMASPTIGLTEAYSDAHGGVNNNGQVNQNAGTDANGKPISSQDAGNLIGAGGRVRLAKKGLGMLAIQVMSTPNVYGGVSGKATEGQLEAVVELGNKWAGSVYGRALDIEDHTGSDYKAAEGGVALSRRF